MVYILNVNLSSTAVTVSKQSIASKDTTELDNSDTTPTDCATPAFPMQTPPQANEACGGVHCFARFTNSKFAAFALLRFRGFCCVAFPYCSKSTSLLSRKKASATRATRAMPPRYQPSDWMPKFMTRADAMVGANAPPVMAARL